MSPALISFFKTIGIVALLAVLSYLGDAVHLTGIVTPILATLIAAGASALESSIREKTGNAFFGAVSAR